MFSNLKKYLSFTKVNILHAINERESILIWAIVGILEVALFVMLWVSGSKDVIAGFTKEQLIGYYFLVFLLEPILGWYIFWSMKWEISEGHILNSFFRPYKYFTYLLFSELGYRIVRCFAQVVTAVGLFFFLGNLIDLDVTLASAILAIPSIIIAILLTLLMQFAMGCVTFFLLESSFVADLNWMLMSLFGGRMIPTEMFPTFMHGFVKYNPYAYMTAFNIKVLMGRLSSGEYLRGLLVGTLWCALFGLASFVLWKVGNRKYAAFGR